MKSDKKILRVIKATEEYLINCKNKNIINQWGSLSIYGCEKRNLQCYKEMLGKDKRKLTGFHKELYKAI